MLELTLTNGTVLRWPPMTAGWTLEAPHGRGGMRFVITSAEGRLLIPSYEVANRGFSDSWREQSIKGIS